MGTPAPSPARRGENLRNPLTIAREIYANRRTGVLRSEVILSTVRPAGPPGSNLMLNSPRHPHGACLHPPQLTQESPP
ncbi:hypothetical protein GCM10010423_17620 [Streptomyces levis]|uniref:Uncharacterized protein n=1 Tax=Streptomyces levis TaxID=285566 RepID=A0ABP6AVD2_9ACTN